MKKKILFYTGSRADYGLLKPLILKFKKDKKFKAFLTAGSHHYKKSLGFTFNEIKADKVKIDFKSSINIKKTTFKEVSKYCGHCIIENSNILTKSNPDLIVILGDRYEVFSFCIAAFFLQIPIVHIHGGEKTEGAFDDSLRHSISKLSDYHFVSHKDYKRRLIQLGEDPERIFNFGALGVENLKKSKLITKKILYKKLDIPLNKKIILITFHPETNSQLSQKEQIRIFLSSLKKLKNIVIIFTHNNADPAGDYFIKMLKKFKKKNVNIKIFSSLGVKLYHSLIKEVDLVVGNSSSGIIEVPSLKTPTLNIGERQKGRLHSKSVFNAPLKKSIIEKKMNNILNNKYQIRFEDLFFKKETSKNMYLQIKKIIKIKKNIKQFYDLK